LNFVFDQLARSCLDIAGQLLQTHARVGFIVFGAYTWGNVFRIKILDMPYFQRDNVLMIVHFPIR
jgi:hypothetical protein